MRISSLSLLFLLCLPQFLLRAQTNDKPVVTPEMRKAYRDNQHLIDMNHGGIGIMLYRPGLGKNVIIESPWVGVNILSDIFEFKFGMGKTRFATTIPSGFSFTEFVQQKDFGYHVSAGINFPIKFLAFGAQHSPHVVFRGHPVLAAEIGFFGMKNQDRYMDNKAEHKIWYFGLNPGYRVRIPTGSVEVNLNMRLGGSYGTYAKTIYKGIGIYPSITFRLDALKWLYNPSMVSVGGSFATLSNVKTETKDKGYWSDSRGNSGYYTVTTTTADVTVEQVNFGIQDIGLHLGIGLKFSFMNPKRTPYVPSSYLVGIVAEGRGGPVDFGLTVEGGKVGHGSRLEARGASGKYRKKLQKIDTFAMGTMNTVNAYLNVGVDISPLFLMPFGIAMNSGTSTSYFSATAGLIIGGHFSWGQEFINPTLAQQGVQKQIDQKGETVDRKFLDPSIVASGYLGGFYFSVQVGAMSFKVSNYRYYGAPFASNTLLGIAYRFPVLRQ